ncbi:MAG: TetR/AcrR family transcriptional regulator [Silanimonas sp.]|jgi:AcrR family transcriptional regulator|nr:TetR/AcrR family transcriptional regulator [Silanimonas sp.]
MRSSPKPLFPRKNPVQARSIHTVEAIHAACIQVLSDGGMERLTTTRVAERAGVSVGSLYQYYPNKQSLLAAVLEEYLGRILHAVEGACRDAKGLTAAAMAESLVRAFIKAKFANPDASRALHAVASEVQGEAIVARLTHRSQVALCDMLATASDREFSNLAAVSFVLSTTTSGPVQALLMTKAAKDAVDQVESHLALMLASYLNTVGAAKA